MIVAANNPHTASLITIAIVSGPPGKVRALQIEGMTSIAAITQSNWMSVLAF